MKSVFRPNAVSGALLCILVSALSFSIFMKPVVSAQRAAFFRADPDPKEWAQMSDINRRRVVQALISGIHIGYDVALSVSDRLVWDALGQAYHEHRVSPAEVGNALLSSSRGLRSSPIFGKPIEHYVLQITRFYKGNQSGPPVSLLLPCLADNPFWQCKKGSKGSIGPPIKGR